MSRLRDLRPGSLGFLTNVVAVVRGRRRDRRLSRFQPQRLLGEGSRCHARKPCRIKAPGVAARPLRLMFTANLILSFSCNNIQTPRATVQTQTSPAPAATSTRAQALVVAPVVKTSSTSTIRSPFSRWPVPHGKGVVDIRQAFLAAQLRLRARGHGTRRSSRLFTGIRVAAPSRPGEALRLVEFALTLLGGVQRDRHDHGRLLPRPTPALPR